MKRLFGTIGFTYLSTLAVVYYLAGKFAFIAVGFIATVLILCGIFLLIDKKIIKLDFFKKFNANIGKTFITIGATVLVACQIIILYQNYWYQPIVDNYSNKEVNITGYVCEEVNRKNMRAVYVVMAESINGENANTKICVSTYNNCKVEEFDCINARLTLTKTTNDSYISNKVFLKANLDEDSVFESTGKKHYSPYFIAVQLRLAMKSAFDNLLPSKYSSFCKAILLGDKNSLSYKDRASFTDTGTSYLIVVSGMHLVIISFFIVELLKRFTCKKRIILTLHSITIFLFMAITGFGPSVVRAGVMLIIANFANLELRQADSINSLGFAGILLSIFNPFVVGDYGMLLSFVATFGIIMFGNRIKEFLLKCIFKIKFLCKNNILRKFIIATVEILATSISASIWIIPVTTVLFGRVSLYVVLLSLIVYPAVFLLITFAFTMVMLYIVFATSLVTGFLAAVCSLLCDFILFIINFFAKLPHPYINSDKTYFYAWIITTALVVLVGYLVEKNKTYIRISSFLCFVSFAVCCICSLVTAESDVILSAYKVGNGVSATVQNGRFLSVISCGGSIQSYDDIIDDITDKTGSVDYIIIPDKKLKYSRYAYDIAKQFDSTNILLYDNSRGAEPEIISSDRLVNIGENTQFELMLSESVKDTVLNVDGITYQLIESKGSSALLAPTGADFSKLPKNFVNADYLIVDSVPKGVENMHCRTVIFSGTRAKFKECYNSLSEISLNVICTFEDVAEIKM